jgi:hypothetical protein
VFFVVITPPSPEVIVFNGCKEKVEISACLQEPILNNLLLYLYSDPSAWHASSIRKKLYFTEI